MTMPAPDDPTAISVQYARRDAAVDAVRYSLFDAAALQAQQERIRAMLSLWRAHGWYGIANLHIAEAGCGAGGNLIDLLRLGAMPEHLIGIELLGERAAVARVCLPASVVILHGDASVAPLADGSQDAVLAFTVFSSLLDDGSQMRLASAMWRWVRPGGGVMIYDFVVGNPRNPDVRGVPVRRLRELFPQGRLSLRHVTLAPPVSRALARLGRGLVAPVASCLPMLKTHRLVWVAKP